MQFGLAARDLLDRGAAAVGQHRKAVLSNGGRAAVEKVARGEAEIAVTLISEIVAVKGARLAAPVPQVLQLLHDLCRRHPGEQHRSGRGARFHRRAHRTGDGGSLEACGL